MAILDRIFGIENRTTLVVTGAGVGQDSTLNRIFGDGGSTTAGVNVTEEKAQTISAVYRAVTLIAGTIASLPKFLYARVGDNGDKEPARDHPLFAILHRRPNVEMSPFFFNQLRLAYTLLWGRSYAYIERKGRGSVKALWPMKTCEVKRQRLDSGLTYDVTRVKDNDLFPRPPFVNPRMLFASEVLELSTFDGESIISHAREQLGESIAAQQHGSGFYAGGAQPYIAIKHPGQIKDPARFRENWEKVHGGSRRKVAILESGAEIQEIGMPLKDAQFLESRKFYVTEIARWFGVPPHKLMDLERATFCLPAESEIYTARGPKRIADIKRGDSVWSLGKDGRFQLSIVNRSECTGQDDILLFKTTNRTLRLNARHRVLSHRKHPKPRSGIGGYQCVEWITDWVPAGELRVGDMIVNARRLPDTKRNITPTRPATVEFMEFCGLLLGDGNIYKRNRSAYVTIARATKAAYMDHYRNVARSAFCRSARGGRGNVFVRRSVAITLQEGLRYTRFSSLSAVKELATLGFSGTAKTKRVPDWVFGMGDEYKLALLRGFLDADGSVDKLGRISFSSCNETMLSQIRHLCIALNIPVTNLRCQEGVTTLPNGKQKVFKQYCFTCSDPGQNRLIGSHDPRYVERLDAGKPFGKKGRAYPDFGGNEFNLANCELARISAIEHHPAEPVYDLEVEGTHSFIANGVVVHNSNIEEQQLEWYEGLLPWLVMIEQEEERMLLQDNEADAYFIEHNVDGLLRGNIQQRYLAYAQGIQWGFLNRNEVRRRENLNSMGEDGDIFLVPGNMTTADSAGNLMEPAATPPAQPPNPMEPTDEMQMRVAATALGESIRRMLVKEIADIREAAKRPDKFLDWLDGFRAKWPAKWLTGLRPAVAACHALGIEGDTSAIDLHCRSAADGLLELAGKATPANLLSAVLVETETWNADIPRLLTASILGEKDASTNAP